MPGSYYIQYRCDGIASYLKIFDASTNAQLYSGSAFGGPSASDTSWTDNFDMNGGLVTVSNAGSSNATISFEYHGQTLTFDTSAYVFNSSNGYYNTAGAFAPQIIPSPTIQAFANIQLNATPTSDNHLVTKTYVTNNYLGVSSVAPTWASNNDYAYGDLVIYKGKLYRCTTEYNNNTPSSLNGWEAAKLIDTATSSFYGLVKPGTGIGVSNGTINLNAATTSSLGGVIVGDGLTVSSGTVSVSWGRKKIQGSNNGTIYLRDNVGVYTLQPTSNTTVSFNLTNLTTSSDYSIEFTLVLIEKSTLRTITLPNTITWLGTQPTFDTTNTAYIIDMFSYNGGTNWFASYRGTMPSSAITNGAPIS